MEHQHLPTNPWSFQQLEHRYDSEQEQDDNDDENTRLDNNNDKNYRRRSSINRRHYSYASSITIAPEEDEEEEERLQRQKYLKDDSDTQFSYTPPKDKFSDLDIQSTTSRSLSPTPTTIITTTITPSLESHVTTWCEDTDMQTHCHAIDSPSNHTTHNSASDEHSTALSLLNEDHNGDPVVERNISDSGVGLEHIVDELKMLLADAEGTLVGSDDSDGGESVAVSSKHGSGTSNSGDEDSNVVYNRICNALQSLISEAQTALERSSTSTAASTSGTTTTTSGTTTITAPTTIITTTPGISTSLLPIGPRPCRHQLQIPHQHQQQPQQRQLLPPEFSIDDGNGDGEHSFQLDGICGHSSCRTSRRSSVISHGRSENNIYYNSFLTPSTLSLAAPSTFSRALSTSSTTSSSRIQAYAAGERRRGSRDAFSRMMWKEKQMEQYERYRRSCDRVSLELQMLLNDTMMDTTVDLLEEWEYLPQPKSTSASSSSSSSAAAVDQSSSTLPSTTTTTTDTGSSSTTPLPSLNLPDSNNTSEPSETLNEKSVGVKQNFVDSSAKAERLQRLYQAQLLSPQVRARQLRRRSGYEQSSSSSSYVPIYPYRQQQQHQQQQHHHQRQSSSSSSHSQRTRPRTSSPTQRQFRNQSVGPSRPPRSVLVQLYELWKHTWLRRRIMHVLAESIEIMLILWVVLKLGDAILSWMGIHLLQGGPQSWLKYINGDRQGDGSLAAKELYLKIRKDGLQWTKIGYRKKQESEQLMKEFKSEVDLLGMARTPFNPSGMVWGPARKMLTHAVSGVVLAYLVDQARRLSKKL
ncbi:hypothetical protein BGZ49_002405 [Haplosporangium sp. Z 27]|nr:hypothetical protein BGZ49_002405 [Haplosporangium sp. Z 27]